MSQEGQDRNFLISIFIIFVDMDLKLKKCRQNPIFVLVWYRKINIDIEYSSNSFFFYKYMGKFTFKLLRILFN